MCSIDPYANSGHFTHTNIRKIPEDFVRTHVPGNLPGKEPMEHRGSFGSGRSALRVEIEVIAAQDCLGDGPLNGGQCFVRHAFASVKLERSFPDSMELPRYCAYR